MVVKASFNAILTEVVLVLLFKHLVDSELFCYFGDGKTFEV